MQKTKFALSIVSAAALLTLAACGGGGGDSASAAQQPATPTPPAPTITVQGSATVVSGDPLAVILVPQGSSTTKTVTGTISSASFAAQFQKATAEGAYTQFGVDANSLVTLSSGKVVDVAGNGDFAIGRWTDGGSSVGTINSNQGSHYAVGRPIKLLPDLTVGAPDIKVNCSAVASTSPTAVSGNFAPGKLNSAVAVVDLTFATLDSFNLDVAIGSDAHATAAVTGSILNGVFIAGGVLQQVQTFGPSATKPYLAIGYAIPTPTSGDVTGVVVLKCQ
ncbi:MULTISPECIES: hypothetical protein [unclassified Cupriavidus]|uniref:hypothetical protein n=1 Tax=unclassified Cupriavidus TaxID=2640874 RepID=UPI0010F4C67E|nr:MULTISPECIES: hypothetical protein [unclassified Cupriavidus]MWL92051.1 hypothetical protein [Cupriavidus sp. SW-Y-13]